MKLFLKAAYKTIVFILLVGCSSKSPISVPVTTGKPISPSLAPNPTYTYTATWTPLPTNTIAPTVTWTPLPTLSAQEVQSTIKELLETNGECELPCWWGIFPNKTLWPEALHFLSPLISNVGQGGRGSYFENGVQHFTTNFGVEYEIENVSNPGSMYFGVVDDIVSDMTIFPPATEYQYQLHQLMTLFGHPKQILISAQQSSPIPDLPPTVIILDYSDAGVWAAYGYIPNRVGETLLICPHPPKENVAKYEYPNVGGRLELFDPNMDRSHWMSIKEYADMVGGFTAMKLEDVTNMNIESFYNNFVDINTNVCLETPADLWP